MKTKNIFHSSKKTLSLRRIIIFCIMSAVAVIDCVDGVELERNASGRIRYVKIDIDAHPFVASMLQERGLVNGALDEEEDQSWLIPTPAVEVDCRNIKWSKKMLKSFEEVKRGQIRPLDLNNFWNVENE